MKKYLLYLLALLPFTLSAQEVDTLPRYIDNLKMECLSNSTTQLYLTKSFNSRKTSPKALPKHINKLFEDTKNIESKTIQSNVNLLKRFEPQIVEYSNSITSFGDSYPLLYFQFYDRDIPVLSLPVSFSLFNDSLTFSQAGIYYDKSLNTLQLNVNERAEYIVSNLILPSLFNLKSLIDLDEIKYFSIIAGYTAKDFSAGRFIRSDSETTSIVIHRDVLKKYINAELTDQELLKQSNLYNQTGSYDNVKKFSL